MLGVFFLAQSFLALKLCPATLGIVVVQIALSPIIMPMEAWVVIRIVPSSNGNWISSVATRVPGSPTSGFEKRRVSHPSRPTEPKHLRPFSAARL